MWLARSALIFFFFLALAILHLTLATDRLNREYQIEKLASTLETLAAQEETLAYEVATLSSLDRIERIAQSQGMRPADKVVPLVLGPAVP